jgi:prepilin peptidase CpaA
LRGRTSRPRSALAREWNVAIAETICFVLFGAVAVVWDARYQRLPNRLTMTGLAVALVLRALAGGAPLLAGLEAGGLALLVALPFYAVGAIGAGDAKLLAALGAFAGLGQLRPGLLAAGVLGGLLALGLALARGRLLQAFVSTKMLGLFVATGGRRGWRPRLEWDDALRVPYGIAIVLGFLAARFLPLARWL